MANGNPSGASFRSYRDLEVWRAGVGLVSQMQRAATAIPANIAEGHGRESTQDFIRFLRIAQGSLKELEKHLIIAHKIGYISDQDLGPVLDETDRIGRMTRGLIRSSQERLR